MTTPVDWIKRPRARARIARWAPWLPLWLYPTKLRRTTTPDNPPAPNSLQPGELSIELATPRRLWVGVPHTIDPVGHVLLLDATALEARISALEALIQPQPPPSSIPPEVIKTNLADEEDNHDHH